MKKMCKAIVIDAVKREVRMEEFEKERGLVFMQECVGGLIERGHTLDNNDDIYVNEEGLFLCPEYGFDFDAAHQPFCGSGVIVGCNEKGESIDPASTVEEILNSIVFFGKKKDE